MRRACSLASAVVASCELYCPSESDYSIGGGQWNGQGWTIKGYGGVHGKQTFNLLGGYIEFDIDTTDAKGGVNNNFYLVSPDPSYFKATNDCDIQGQGKPSCMEMDIIENNGNCLAQTTWHTWPNHDGDCDRGGCEGQHYRNGVTHVKAAFSEDGWMTVTMDGAKVDVSHPVPSGNAHAYVKETMAKDGAQIQSSQWVGWVPAGNCPGGGDVADSTFHIRNVRVSGTILQGPEATKCSGPAPSPPSPPSPSPSQCPGNQGQCNCDWTAGGSKCGSDDGSECFCRCCCEHVSSQSCKWHGSSANATVVV